MKKFTTLLLTLCMLLCLVPLAVHADTPKTTDLLSADVLTTPIWRDGVEGSWSFQDGKLVATNQEINDAALMSNIQLEKGKHLYIEATATLDAGMAWGIIFAESGADKPFDNWFCLNMDTDQMNSRLFFINTASKHGTPYGDPSIGFVDAADGKPHTLGLEILADGSMKMYLDGGLHTELPSASFEGATVGIMTCRGSITCTSFTVTEGAPSNVKPYGTPRQLEFSSTTNLLDANVLKYSTAEGFYQIADGKMTTNGRGGGDRAIMSDIYVAKGDHVYIEATGKITEGGAWGLMFSTKKPGEQNPFDGWFCMNVEGYRSRIFSPNSGYDVATPRDFYYLNAGLGNNVDVTLGMEITPDGTFYLTCNGVTYAVKKSENWNGAYIGLMTWESAVEFTAATFSTVKSLKPETTEPDTTPVEPDTTPAQPDTTPVEPDTAPVTPETQPAQTGDTVWFAAAGLCLSIALAAVCLKKRENA